MVEASNSLEEKLVPIDTTKVLTDMMMETELPKRAIDTHPYLIIEIFNSYIHEGRNGTELTNAKIDINQMYGAIKGALGPDGLSINQELLFAKQPGQEGHKNYEDIVQLFKYYGEDITPLPRQIMLYRAVRLIEKIVAVHKVYLAQFGGS